MDNHETENSFYKNNNYCSNTNSEDYNINKNIDSGITDENSTQKQNVGNDFQNIMNEIAIDESVIMENQEQINDISAVMTDLNTVLLDNASRENTAHFKTALMRRDLAKFSGKE